jgi:transcriptional regulator with XRE-family HTH domain/Zn-dependent peptidase ImmA (M78 family)
MRDEHQARIGARIAQLRERQGWSQRALARWVDLDQSAVSRIEAGHRRLSAEELHRFADALHVTADVLLKGDFAIQDSAPEDSVAPDATDSPALEAGLADEEPAPPGSAAPPGWGRSRHWKASRGREASPTDRLAARPPSRSAPSPAAPLAAAESRMLAFSGDADLPALQPPRSPSHPAARTGARGGASLPAEVNAVARDWSLLRLLAATEEPAQRWSTGHSAEGKPERLIHTAAALRPSARAGDVLYDRVARFWRSELHVDPDDGPLPDLVPLLEDGYGAQVIVARVAREDTAAASEHPVAAAFSADGVPFIFVNAARPVVLQRFALAHAFAHHVLGHGDVVDRRIEWSRNVPPEAAANDFAEELLAPVRAVQRWYERRDAPRWVRLEDLLELGNTFGISVWSALYRSRAAGRLQGKQFHVLSGELKQLQWELLPRQAFLGGLRDTLSYLTPGETLPPHEFGEPAVLRVPAAMRVWALAALRGGRLSLEDASALLRLDAAALAEQLARLGLE